MSKQPSSTASTALREQKTRVRTWGWTAALCLLLVLLFLSLLPGLERLPWASQLASWTLPATIAAGMAIYLLSLAVLTLMRTRRRFARTRSTSSERDDMAVGRGEALWQLALFGLAGFLGVLLAVRTATVATPELGALALGGFCAVLGALLLWLVVRMQQSLAALALSWVLLAGTWNLPQPQYMLPTSTGLLGFISTRWVAFLQLPQRVPLLWLGWLLVLSLLIIGIEHLRSEQRLWQRLQLQQIGATRWQGLRALTLFTVLIALIALVPAQLVALSPLQQFWNTGPGTQSGLLPYTGSTGTPVAQAGAPLGLNAPATGDNRILYTYTILAGEPQQTPLLAATFDTYDENTGLWEQSVPAASVTPATALPFPAGAQLLHARITVATGTAATGANSTNPFDTAPLLIGFSSAISFSVPAQAQLLSNADASTLTVSDWRATAPLAPGTSYETVSAVVPSGVAAKGTLPTALIARVTGVPTDLAQLLQPLAISWTAGATTPEAQAEALIQALHKNTTLDAHVSAPSGQDPIAWFFQHRRGNGLMLTSAFILLARSIGLPVRLAEGYLPGTYDASRQALVVRANDATVWTQLAIPNVGWLDLFPATSLHIVIVPRSPAPAGTPTPTAAPNQQAPTLLPPLLSLNGLRASQVTTILLIGSAALLAIVAILSLWLTWRWLLLGRRLPPLARFFARVTVLARLAGIPLPVSDTAAQATRKVANYLPATSAQTLTRLNTAYERLTYGPLSASTDSATIGQTEGRPVQRALWRLTLTRTARKQHRHERNNKRANRTERITERRGES